MQNLSLAAFSKEDLFTYGFLFFFFVLPMIRSLLDKLQKGAGASDRTEDDEVQFDDDHEDDYSGGEAWEKLLRGEYEIAPAKDEAREQAQVGGPVVQTRRLDPSPARHSPARHSPARGGLGSTPRSSAALGSLPSAASAPRSLDSLRDSGASQPNMALHESVTHLAEFHSSSESMSVGGESLSKEFASLQETTQIPATASHRSGSKRALDWRLAIRTREILGPPVSLRNESAEIPGFR